MDFICDYIHSDKRPVNPVKKMNDELNKFHQIDGIENNRAFSVKTKWLQQKCASVNPTKMKSPPQVYTSI